MVNSELVATIMNTELFEQGNNRFQHLSKKKKKKLVGPNNADLKVSDETYVEQEISGKKSPQKLQ